MLADIEDGDARDPAARAVPRHDRRGYCRANDHIPRRSWKTQHGRSAGGEVGDVGGDGLGLLVQQGQGLRVGGTVERAGFVRPDPGEQRVPVRGCRSGLGEQLERTAQGGVGEQAADEDLGNLVAADTAVARVALRKTSRWSEPLTTSNQPGRTIV